MADNNTDVLNQYLRINSLVDNEVEIVVFYLIKFAIAEQWEIGIESIKMDSTLADLGGDDFDLVELIMYLEETFDIEIPESEMEIDSTIESIFKIILNLIQEKSEIKNKNLIIETIAFCESLNSSDETAIELTNKCFEVMKSHTAETIRVFNFWSQLNIERETAMELTNKCLELMNVNKTETIKIFNFWSQLNIARETAMELTNKCFELMKVNKAETIKIFNFVSKLNISKEEAINLVSACFRWVREKQEAQKMEKLKELKNTLNEQILQVQKLEAQIKLLEQQIQS